LLNPKEKHGGLAELERIRAAIVASGDVAYEWDLATDNLIWCGDAASLFGGNVPATGEIYHGLINPQDLPRRLRVLSDHLADSGVYETEYRVRGGNGDPQWVHDRGAVEHSASGAATRMVGMLRAITSLKEHEAQLEYLANFDDLTGHYNKVRLREALDHALANSLRFGQTGAYMLIGIDQLGMINTAYGFEVGDAVLVEIARRLDHCMRVTDVIGRPGGDRFGVVMESCSEEQARVAADRLLQWVRRHPIETNGTRLTVTASAGIVVFPSQSQASFDVMAKAESALLKAKSAGRDCSDLYEMTEEQRLGYRAHMDIGEEVKEALKENRLVLAYQPVVEAVSRRVAYYECLLRMVRPDGEMVVAADFIPVVEQLGLMRNIDRHVLDLAIEDLERYPDISLAINISGLTAADRAWLRDVTFRLRGRPTLARRLMVEITETAALNDVDESARFVATIRELECKVALDDFGAGYTTFRHLKDLTADLVKIDGSFVTGIAENKENIIFVRNLLALARALDLATVAECVENEVDADFLTREGIDYLQGRYFGMPNLSLDWSGKEEGDHAPPGEVITDEMAEMLRRRAGGRSAE
jgi:diguanylate cyclase (GGDEF)-like protein